MSPGGDGQGPCSLAEAQEDFENRACINSFLAKSGLSANSTMSITGVSRGFSLNDSYCVVRAGDMSTFALYENRFSRVLVSIALTGSGSAVRSYPLRR